MRGVVRENYVHLARRASGAAQQSSLLFGLAALSAWTAVAAAPAFGQTTAALTLPATCDGSAAAWLDDTYFVDANDEDPVLRVYSAVDGKLASEAVLDVSPNLALGPLDEPDLEGAARIGNRIYWITSHGLDSDGVIRPERHRLFATNVIAGTGAPRLAWSGRPYLALLKDIADAAESAPALAKLDLPGKARIAPELPDGLNIEALAEGPDGALWLGFRGPLYKSEAGVLRALVLPVLNPGDVLDPVLRAKPRFDAPVLLDLGGRGIRDIARTANGYLLVAGSVDAAPTPGFALYSWSGKAGDNPVELDIDLTGMRPEAVSARGGRLLILSDDGDEKPTSGKKCKKLAPTEKRFLGRVVLLSELRPRKSAH